MKESCQPMSLIVTNKQLDTIALALRPYTRLIALEGATRSSKTADIIQAFYYCVYLSKEKYHAICGQSYDTINRNILDAKDVGLLQTHPELTVKKKQTGGYYISMKSPNGEKEIILAGYSDARKWKAILGSSLGVVLIDEVNIANKDFLDETFARQTSCDNPKTFLTLNGDSPDHLVYQEIINYCRVIGNCPSSTRSQMMEFQKTKGIKEGYYYIFYSMLDNPIMTPDKVKRAYEIYPVGSYYYITKILGERGNQGKLVYVDYMKSDLIVDAWGKDNGKPRFDLYRFTIGGDVGATKASNVFSLIGWGKDYSYNIVMRCMPFKSLGYTDKVAKLCEFLDGIIASGVNKTLIEAIYIDSAEANFIRDLQPIIKARYGIDVLGSYKATIRERIDMNVIGFSSHKTLIDRTCSTVYDAFSRIQVGKSGEARLDENKVETDIVDSVEYGQTRHMKALMTSIGGWK